MILIILNIKFLEIFLNHFMKTDNNCNFCAISSILAHLTLFLAALFRREYCSMSILIKAIIFDLDNCLAPAKQISEAIYMPAFNAMRAANKDVVTEDNLTKAFADCWRHPLDWVASHYGFSAEMLKAGWDEFSRMEIKEPIYGYEELTILAELPVKRYLVTSGFRKLQESKINLLGIKKLFDKTYVDALDEPNRLGKKGLFELIMRENNFFPSEILVVGDNSDSEIAAGNQLGMRTVQTLRPNVPKGTNATFYVKNLIELQSLYLYLVDNKNPENFL